jgi:hypothetical protein
MLFQKAPQNEAEIANYMAKYYSDPFAFVMSAYPWGKPGTSLEKFQGPDQWQEDLLRDIGREVYLRGFNGVDPVAPIREAVASGHGIGKSTMVAWLVDWLMSTRPGCKGTVTANTVTQLETKTWPAIDHWTRICVTRPFWWRENL